jgi:hypothetical protein
MKPKKIVFWLFQKTMNLKYFFIYCLALALLSSCNFEPERNCKDFKDGKFEFEAIIDGVPKKTTFVRKGNLEIDYFENKIDSSSIRWINDCEYIVKHLNPKNMAEQKSIHMKILSTTTDSYTFEYGIVGSNKKLKGTAKKIK